jgi:hypothetical protein
VRKEARVRNRALGPAALLLAALSACGGGPAAKAPDAAALAAAGDETSQAPAAPKPGAPAPKPRPKVDETQIPEPGAQLPRESYSFSGGSRDPFESVLTTGTVGPELPDLDLVAVYFNSRTPGASVAVLRDRVSGRNFTIKEGVRLGRMRVTSIRQKDVLFTIDDYGTERQESLALRKQEGTKP